MTPVVILLSNRNDSSVWGPGEVEAAIANVVAGAVVSFLLYRFARRVPWPWPFRLRFALLNLAAALATGLLWWGLSTALEGLLIGSLSEARTAVPWRRLEFLFLGGILYVVVAAITYSVEASARAARAETVAARTQLAALRAQIHPHFLFNALHAVVQLIPTDPVRAAEAAELVASLLRTTLEEGRNEVTIGDEWAFVSRYLEVEHIRFGDRLRVRADVDPNLLDEKIPAFALQTLVENAVRHGAAQSVGPTEIVITAAAKGSDLEVAVRNTGERRLPSGREQNETGTGLSRLREQLAFLYGSEAGLTYGAVEDGGFVATLVVPRRAS